MIRMARRKTIDFIHYKCLSERGRLFAPDNVTVIGGKTGTTNAAGSCLILYSKDQSGNPYISVILPVSDRTTLYQEMTGLLMRYSFIQFCENCQIIRKVSDISVVFLI